MSPIVGITQCLDDRGRWREGRDYVYLDHAYARAVEEAGGTPILLPPQRDAAALASRIDALVVPGGDDFVPEPARRDRYPEGTFDPAPDASVAFDRRLLAAALDRGLPFLGICYGMQLLAAHHGGTLHYDLALDRPGSQEHRLPEDGTHSVTTEPGTRLAAILGPRAAVNSLHHQAVDEPGDGLRVSARSEDGVVEAIEAATDEGGSFAIGVQWHPEKLGDAAGRTALFRALVEATS